MTIKIEAWQSHGKKTDHCVDKYEFCCWESLKRWLEGFTPLNKCPKCEKRSKQKNIEKVVIGGRIIEAVRGELVQIDEPPKFHACLFCENELLSEKEKISGMCDKCSEAKTIGEFK
jgi:hypothetical protein